MSARFAWRKDRAKCRHPAPGASPAGRLAFSRSDLAWLGGPAAADALGLSHPFTGLVIVAVAGNAVENVVGIKLAAADKPDYAPSVILNSALRIALVVAPALVLAFVVYDGESIWPEGVALVGLYVMFAASMWRG